MTGPSDATAEPALDIPRSGPVFFCVNATVAWAGVLLSLTLSLTGYYVGAADPAKPTILGNLPEGVDSPVERVLDWITYFTILSNIVVALVLTALIVRPGLFARLGWTGIAWRTLRLDSVLMIVITGVVYNLLLAEGGASGWGRVSNDLLHVATPLLTLVVWIIAGPRGLVTVRIVGLSLAVPLLWAVFALVRGRVVGAYPYPFLDVSANGLGSVLVFVVAIVVVAVLLGLALMGVDAALRATSRPPADHGTLSS